MADKDKKFSQSFLDGELNDLCYIEQVEYQPEDGGEPLFMEPPEDNLLFVLQTINSNVRFQEKDKKQISQSVNIAERVIGVDTLSNRDIALASAFFDLGLAFGQGLIHPHKLDQEIQYKEVMREDGSKGGRKSWYERHEKFITTCIEEVIEHCKSQEAISRKIKNHTGKKPNKNTMTKWVKDAKLGNSIF
mgnify:FL=1